LPVWLIAVFALTMKSMDVPSRLDISDRYGGTPQCMSCCDFRVIQINLWVREDLDSESVMQRKLI